MWSRVVDGQVLTFRMLGLNNQNFMMTDEQTGTWWQQVTGEAIQGPLAGKRLARVPSDEVRLAIWRQDHPDTTVMAYQEAFADNYLAEDWETNVAESPVPEVLVTGREELGAREVVIGVALGEQTKAYSREVLRAQGPIIDFLGGVPIVLAIDADGQSVRCFDRRLDGRTLELFAVPDADSFQMLDAETGSTWDFAGRAIDGEAAGQQLTRVQTLTSFWFDWRNQNPETLIYDAGMPQPGDQPAVAPAATEAEAADVAGSEAAD